MSRRFRPSATDYPVGSGIRQQLEDAERATTRLAARGAVQDDQLAAAAVESVVSNKKGRGLPQVNKGEELFALQLRGHRIRFEREYRFHPGRLYRLDFAFPELRLAVEIDGGVWKEGGGAHSHPTNVVRDMERHNELMLAGWRYLRLLPEQVDDGTGILLVLELREKMTAGDAGKGETDD